MVGSARSTRTAMVSMSLSSTTVSSVLSLLVLATLASAQITYNIIPASVSSCVNQCDPFTEAQTACQPDAANAATYQSCFCASAYLIPLKSSANNICPTQCPDADFTSVAAWFATECGGVAPASTAPAVPPPATTLATAAAAGGPTTASVSSSASAAASVSSSAQNQQSGGQPDESQEWTNASAWFHDHWKWIVMIIVLFVAFLAIGIIGSIWYRRVKRRREYGDSTAPLTNRQEISQWAPGQHSVHDFASTPGANLRSPRDTIVSEAGVMGGLHNGSSEFNKGKEVVRNSEVLPAPPPSSSTAGRSMSRNSARPPATAMQ